MRRAQLFEWNDLPWIPAALRDSIVEALSRTLAWGHMMGGLVEPFGEFLTRAGTREVLDLCAGAGAPAAILASEFRRSGRPVPRFVLTDLFPRLPAWERLRAADAEAIGVHESPVDATAIPAALAEGRARVVINALHHFPPALARGIFADAIAQRAPIFVSEAFDRNPLRFLAFAPVGIPAMLANPLLSPERRLQKALLTWLTPAVLMACAWDGVVSTLRIYRESDLREMVASAGGERYDWTWGTYRYPPQGIGHFFHGVPRG